MKRMVSKIFCVIMALCVFLGAMPVVSFAQEDMPFNVEMRESGPVQQYDPSTIIKHTNKTPVANQYFSSGADDMYLFYSYLTNNQKKVYDTVKAAGLCIDQAMIVPLDTAIEGTATVSNNTLYLSDEVWDSVYNVVMPGLASLMDDHPEMFWIYSFSYGIGNNYSYYATDDASIYRIVVNLVRVTIRIKTSVYADATVVESYYNQLIDAVNNFEVHGITRYEKLKSIHDTIVKQVQYDPDYDNSNKNPTDHEPVSVFTEPFLTVCEGYAEAFKLICDREGIPCIVVVGTSDGYGHAWNYVKMEDNKWYAVDATWDDPLGNNTSSIYYNYFLAGSGTLSGGQTFLESHVPDGSRFSSGSFALTYPTLTTDHYGKVMLGKDAGDVTVEDSMNVIFIGKDITTVSGKFAIPSGFDGSLSSYTDLTGGTLTTTKTATNTSKTYIFAKRGDIDGSNITNTTDYNKVVTASTLGACPSKNTAEYYAGDINHDGAIDGFDAITLELYLNDTIDFN